MCEPLDVICASHKSNFRIILALRNTKRKLHDFLSLNISKMTKFRQVLGSEFLAFSFKVTVDLRGVFWGKQYSALCINGRYINLYIIGELI